MTSFLIAFLFGAVMAILLARLISAVNKGRKGRAFLLTLILFAAHGVAIWLIMSSYISYLANLLCGFLVGLPLTGIFMVFYSCYLGGVVRNFLSRRRIRRMK